MAKVTVYVDPTGAGGAGHAFIALTDDNGNISYWGYYSDTNDIVGNLDMVYDDGVVLDETTRYEWDERYKNAIPIASEPISTDQYNDINNYIQDRIENPGDYFLAGEIGEQTDNCATFIGDVLDAGGIDNGFGNVPNWFEDDKKFYDMYGDNYDGIGSDNRSTIPSFESYNSQQSQQIIIDPLALDLNHNGKIDTTNANSSKAFFDMDNNGMSEITGWIDKEDGLLVYDKNNNGKIDNINELFGNENKDGYRELRELINSNGDNVIDKNDTKFKDLKIWQDLNGDGISQNNELKTLDELNITSINLNSKNTNIDDNGNNIFKTSTFTQNGQEYLSGDVNFAVDKRFTDFRGDYTLSVDALFLPWLRGYGNVKDAHIAYSMDEEFKEFTKTLVGDDEKAYNEFDTYLKKWSGLDKVHSANGITRDTLTMDDKVWIMETLSGKDFFKSRIETAYSNNRNSSNRYDTGYIDEQYNNLKTKNYSIFASQSFYKDGFNGSYYSVNQDKMVVYDKELLNNSIVEFINSSSNIKDAMGFVFALDKLKNDLDINIADLTNNITNNKEMIANVLNDTANLSIFQNSFNGSSGDDIVFGTDGDDNIYNKKMVA